MAKRILQGVIVFFAVYAFVFVPLGRKTALEHMRAIFGTPQAREAASEVKGGVTRLVRRLRNEARRSTEASDELLEDTSEPARAEERAGQPAKNLRALSAESPHDAP